MTAEPVAEMQLHEKLLEELKTSPRKLRPPEEMHDKSAPLLEPGLHVTPFPKDQLLSEIQHGVPLHHVDAGDRHDTSAPYIEEGLKLEPNRHAELMEEVRTVGTHKMAMQDSKQDGEAEAHKALLDEVLHHAPLTHLDPALQHDTSVPHLTPPPSGAAQVEPAGDAPKQP